MMRAPFDPAFLARICFVKAALWFEAMTPLELPPFGGSALRGAFGWALRQGLCPARPACQVECGNPASCPYFLLFEKERNERGQNIPKPYILEPPVPQQLEQIAAGAPVKLPYELRNGDLEGVQSLRFEKGALFAVGFTLLGQTIPLLTPVIDLLASRILLIGAGRARLVRVEDAGPGNRTLYDRSSSARETQAAVRQNMEYALHQRTPVNARVVFRTPTRLRAQAAAYCFDAEQLAEHFWQTALTRAIEVHDTFCAGPGEERLPFYELAPELPRLTSARIFHYRLPRLSNRQRRFMDFDGIVGRLDYSGDFSVVKPLVIAAETLHVGQKATFGLGRITCSLVDGM